MRPDSGSARPADRLEFDRASIERWRVPAIFGVEAGQFQARSTEATIPPMHALLKSSLVALLASPALLAPAARAQLILTGTISANATDSPGPHDTIFNAPDGSSAWFKSGIPEWSSDQQTGVAFTQKSFTDVGPGLVASNLFTVTNGRTLFHSTATAAHFDLSLDLISPTSHSVLLTAVPFSIVNTPNGPDPQSVDDLYSVASSPIAPFKVGSTWVQFKFTAPDSFAISEDSSMPVGDLSVSFTPVPEPAIFSAAGAIVLLGLVVLRMRRRPPKFA